MDTILSRLDLPQPLLYANLCQPAHRAAFNLKKSIHTYYLPLIFWPLSVSQKNNSFYTNSPPPPLHATLTIGAAGASPQRRGSQCTLTSGQKQMRDPCVSCCQSQRDAAAHTARLQDPNPSPRSLQYPSYHYATTYLVVDSFSKKPILLLSFFVRFSDTDNGQKTSGK